MPSYTRDYTPIFHKDNTVTYWDPRYQRWCHRVHPQLVHGRVARTWNKPCREKLLALNS